MVTRGPGFISWISMAFKGFPGGSVVKNPPAKQEMQVLPRVRKIPWSRKWQPSPAFLHGKSHGQRSLAGYGVAKEADMTWRLNKSTGTLE